MLILQLTDFHVTRAHTLLAGVDTRAAFSHLMHHVAQLEPQPDLILVSGDVAETGAEEEYAWASAGLRALGIPFLVLPGNHDLRAPLRRAFRDETGEEASHLAFSRSVAGVRVIGLDTLVEGQAHGALSNVQLAWLERELETAGTEPVVIAMHHPPFRTGIPAMDKIGLVSGGEALAQLLNGRETVAGILCGHVHRAIFGMFVGIPTRIAPSASHQFALDFEHVGKFTIVQEPPQLALHQISPEDGRMTSYLVSV